MKKNPWVAAILNLIIGGAGYLYVGKRVLFGTLLLITDLYTYYWMYTDPAAKVLAQNGGLIFVGFLFMFALAYDGYRNAQEVNKK